MIVPAIVSNVHADGTVDLCVFDAGTGIAYGHNVRQGQGEKEWDWMPFQKDQQLRVGYNNTGKITNNQNEQGTANIQESVQSAPTTGTIPAQDQGQERSETSNAGSIGEEKPEV
jgi:hypothetical protein